MTKVHVREGELYGFGGERTERGGRGMREEHRGEREG